MGEAFKTEYYTWRLGESRMLESQFFLTSECTQDEFLLCSHRVPTPRCKKLHEKAAAGCPEKKVQPKNFLGLLGNCLILGTKKTSIFLHFLFLNKLFAVDFRGHQKFSSRKLKVLLSFFPWRRRRCKSLLACTTQPRQRHAPNEPNKFGGTRHTPISHTIKHKIISVILLFL